jgi:TctA family transporter
MISNKAQQIAKYIALAALVLFVVGLNAVAWFHHLIPQQYVNGIIATFITLGCTAVLSSIIWVEADA